MFNEAWKPRSLATEASTLAQLVNLFSSEEDAHLGGRWLFLGVSLEQGRSTSGLGVLDFGEYPPDESGGIFWSKTCCLLTISGGFAVQTVCTPLGPQAIKWRLIGTRGYRTSEKVRAAETLVHMCKLEPTR